MSWTSVYRLALWLLPVRLRCKHGGAMEALFARDLARAQARGALQGALAGAAGVWDVVRRGAYEQLRPRGEAAGERSPGDRFVPEPTLAQHLRRHAVLFAIAFAGLTIAMLALYARKQVPAMTARGATVGTVLEMLLLSVPFTAAMTIPMAVFLAVLSEFSRLGADGTLAAARHVRGGVRRLVLPVVAAAVAIASLTLALNTEVLPRANARLAMVLAIRPASSPRSDREMTVGELRAAARHARVDGGREAVAMAANYEVEVQKKYALAAACVVLALAGAVIPLRIPRGGITLVIGACCAVYFAYYTSLVTGEDLARRLVISPFVGMWGANVLLLAIAVVTLSQRRALLDAPGSRSVATGA